MSDDDVAAKSRARKQNLCYPLNNFIRHSGTVQPQIREATLPLNSRPENVARYLSNPFALRPAANGPADLHGSIAIRSS